MDRGIGDDVFFSRTLRIAVRSKFMKPDGQTARIEKAGMPCIVEGCTRFRYKGGLCQAHVKRRTRGKTVAGPIGELRPKLPAVSSPDGQPLGEPLDPAERTLIAGDAFVQCSSDDDELYKYRRKNFLKAAALWLEALGWRPPRNAMRKLARL